MKKNVPGNGPRRRILLLCALLALGGCVKDATPISYAPAAPAERTCALNIAATLTVTDFDGESVEWTAGFADSWAAVQIPAGSHTFVLDYNRNVSGGSHYQNSLSVSYDNFMAGHTYEMVAAEGAEAGGFTGLFTNMFGAMLDTVQQALRIGIRDITDDRQGDFIWLQLEEPDSFESSLPGGK
ncbi:MAG: hypothetical protein LBQ63_05620 [Deltaproteobacteria bacterium]|jgi:hypothetical protein|nr:hypothetical protein [Deltaproteobacteria bacterium]